ncbi:hypothetical protein SAMN05192559_10652 [Halobacillus karajensis]|uniref:Uncharacterized protein n=1 Tax=Halobacillus karajensis TaxID=195088 RepID=A0A059NZ57_9BACI|nr:hypothetical protein BN982_03530 [Halobacillus karajensis]CDQ24771.1 hypothetical protein BN983_03068 [Halobacillus karajensis]CDQ28869.1 hypothetical protein BN981_03186 [Halobacillus karajensis]SEH95394.1 hypothetical protein SAMN05192559_10652 [Halobacillus karajensis]
MRLAVFSLAVVLIAAVFLYLDNREINALKGDKAYPMIEEPTQHPQPITASSFEMNDSSIHLTKLYSKSNAKGLYLGMWYGVGNNKMNNREKEWKREEGQIEFLVKAVDSNGSTYNGHTIGTSEGTFTTFRYVQFDEFRYKQGMDKIDLYFYPILDEGKGGTPYEHAWFETTVELD